MEDELTLEAETPGAERSLDLDEEEEFLRKIKTRRPIRPEVILGILAALSAALLIVMIVLCLPYMSTPEKTDEDPAALAAQHHAAAEYIPTEVPTEPAPEETAEPTEPIPVPERNPYDKYDFQYTQNNYLLCLRQDSYPGIDVSAYQGDIDWQKVKDSGIRFAFIRLGYRGYGTGKLVEDEYAQKNLKEATEAGLPIGVYFFSQALNIKEVDEEIDYMLDILGDYELSMPIILDWEIPTEDARTANMDARTLTDLQLHFCETMTEKGFQPMVYFNWNMSSNLLYLTELEEYPFWLAFYQDRMTYPYRVEFWQYTDQGRVPGINGNVDINVYMPDLD